MNYLKFKFTGRFVQMAILFSSVFSTQSNGQIINSLLRGNPTDTLITNYHNIDGGLTAISADNEGNVYVLNNGNHRILKINKSGVTTIVAGSDNRESSSDGRLATSTHLDTYLHNIISDAKGNIYFSTSKLKRIINPKTKLRRETWIQGIRKISVDGILSTIHTFPEIQTINCFTVDKDDNLYVAENAFIKKIAPNGKITTIVDSSAFKAFLNDRLVFDYLFNSIAIDKQGNLYVGGNNWVLKINKEGVVSKIAGNGKSFKDKIPVTDLEGNIIRYQKNNTDCIKALDGQLATSGSITSNNSGPENYINICLDQFDNLYFVSESTGWTTDSLNNKIRKVNKDGIITTIVGDGIEGYSDWDVKYSNHKIVKKDNQLSSNKSNNGDGGLATSAQLSRPSKISFDGQGNLIILDNSPYHIRVVSNVGLSK